MELPVAKANNMEARKTEAKSFALPAAKTGNMPVQKSEEKSFSLPAAKSTEPRENEHVDAIAFYGLNKLPRMIPGEVRAMTNISSKYPGCLCTRPPRETVRTLTKTGYALFAASNGKLCWVDGTNFVYDGTTKGTVTAGAKSMADFYGVILIFPDKKYYNYNTDTFAALGSGTYPDDDGAVPDMDSICVFENRVWGVKGLEAYASKYNDPFTWTQFTEVSAEDDSIYLKLPPERGSMVGLIPLENHMLFTTNISTYEGYGTARKYLPYLVSQSRGCLSAKSMVEVDGMVFMLAADGVTVYSGSHPRPISHKLDEAYVSGVAGTDGRRYYLCLYNGTSYNLYYCDTEYLSLSMESPSAWYREDNLQVKDFAYTGGVLYALTGDNKIIKFNSGSESISCEVETEEFDFDYMGQTITNKIKVEAKLNSGASMTVYLKVDGGSYVQVDTFSYASPAAVKYYKSEFEPNRGERFQIKITWTGYVELMGIVRTVIVGSDVKG